MAWPAKHTNGMQREKEQQALEQLQQGRLEEAEAIYRTLIKEGVISSTTFGNLAAICGVRGKTQEMILLLRKAIAINPNYPEAYNNLGIALKKQGNLQAAIDAYCQALAIKPNYPDACLNLGSALKDQGNLQAAINVYRQALAIKPNYSQAYFNLGIVLKEQDNLQAAIDSYHQALAIQPNYPQAYNNLGLALRSQGNLQAAIDAYRKALAIKPNYPAAYNNLGITLKDQGNLQAAIDACRQALAIKPNYPQAYNNLGNALKEHGDLQMAIDAYRQALAINPDYPEAHCNLSLVQLLLSDYENGWKEYEWRFQVKGNPQPQAHPQIERWNGSNLAPGESLILVGEQGLGDTLQFIRYVLYLNNTERPAALCTSAKLHDLILASGITTVIYSPEQANQLTTGKWLPLLSLPGYLQVRPDHPIVDTPYIKAPEQQIDHWRQKLAAEQRPIIGINWSGALQLAPSGKKEDWRSLPLEAFAPIVEKTNVTLLSLQKGDGSEQLADCSFRHRFVGCQENIDQTWDFVETAAIIANCGLIITSDTAVAHLAAGMGHPTWLLLVKMAEWRWGMEGERSFWYPSMRLFRQREKGNWTEVMERVATALEVLLSHPKRTSHQELTECPKRVTGSSSGQPGATTRTWRKKEQHARKQLQQGHLEEAEVIYRKLIEEGAVSDTIFGNLAAIYGRKGRTQEMIPLLKRAVAINPNYAEAYFNLGIALKEQGNLQAAIDAYRQALAIKTDYADVYNNLGVALQEQGSFQAAINAYRQALAIKPNYPEVYLNLGNALKAQGNLQAAIDAYRQALAINSSYSQAYFNLGIALKEQDDLQAAIDAYRQALAIKPNYPQAYNNLGLALKDQGNLRDAIDAYRQALSIKPNYPAAYSNLGNTLKDYGDLQAAIDAYGQALAIKPNYPQAYNNLANALKEQGDLQAAIDAYRQALAINPDYPEAHCNLSLVQLLSGDYESGWKEYEWRFRAKGNPQPHAHPQVEQWNGSNLAPGESLILVSEQGLGDTLHFMRYVLYLNNTGQSATLCASTKLHDLIRASGITTVIYSPEQANQITTGKWLPLLSLPGYLQVRPGHPIVHTPYIKVPEQQVDHWRQKLAAEQRPIIGINWSGTLRPAPSGKKEDWRSLPLEAFTPIVEKTTVTLLSLQKGDGSEQLADCSFRHRFVGCQEDINQTWDFVETAAIIANCDLVITSDTAVTHLAAGMGHPTWLLLTQMPEWRWGREGESSFWYPSMRLFRQRERGNWTEVIERVITALEALVSHQELTEFPKKVAGSSSGQPGAMNRVQREKEQHALEKLQQGHLEEAEVIYRTLIEEGVVSDTIFGNLAAICGMQGRTQEIIPLLKRAISINPNCADIYFNLGIALKGQGDLQAAIDAYRQALIINPNFPEIYYNLGIALKDQGDLQAAIDAYRQALAIKPNYPTAYNNLGIALKDQGDLQAAIDAYRQALAIKPNYPTAYNNLGIALKDQGDLQAAIDAYRQALAIKPNYPTAYNNLGIALKDQGDLQAAIDAYRQALAIKPNYPVAHNNLGIALKDHGDLQAAIDAYRQALAIKPNFSQVYNNLGTALQENGNLQAAIDAYRQALTIKPNFSQVYNNLGIALGDQGNLQTAIDAFQQALAINPNYSEAYYNLGIALSEQSDLQAAVDAYRQALVINPNYSEAHWNLSLVQLLSGDYESGWKEYEWRFQAKGNSQPHAHPQIERWTGSNLAPGESLILVSEQGLGDTLHFMRYVLYLNSTGQSAALCAQVKLHDLIRASGITTVIYSPEQANKLTTGKWFPLLSLPGYLQVRPDHPIIDTPYIKAPEQQVDHWRQKLADEQRPIIGINWSGAVQPAPSGKKEDLRSLPLESFAPIVEKTTVTLLSLQKGHGSEQLADCSFRHRFVGCQEGIDQTWDFVETAAIIANCHLVITSDTAVAHLAAGMGRPTWLLLAQMPEWRWGVEGESSFWYPSMRLFRQRERGNWPEVMERVTIALEALLSYPEGTSHQELTECPKGALKNRTTSPDEIPSLHGKASHGENLHGPVGVSGWVGR